MTAARRLALSAAAAALLASVAAAPAFAAGQVTQLSVNGGTLVRGAAPLPEFRLDFLLEDPGRQALEPLSDTDDLEISLNSPDQGAFHFLFSPRPQFGLGLDRVTGARTGYAGLTWNLFDTSTVFGNLGLAGSYDGHGSAPTDTMKPLGPPLMLHGALELGYHIGEQHSLSLSVDQGRSPDLLRGGSETSDNLRLRYGLKF